MDAALRFTPMKFKRRWLLLIVPLALLAWMAQAASWRPKLVGVNPTQPMNGPGMLPSAIVGPKLLVSPNGKILASVVTLRTKIVLTLWAPQTREQLWQHTAPDYAQFPMAFSPDSQTLAVAEDTSVFGRANFRVILVDVATGKQRRAILPGHYLGNLQGAAFLSDKQLVVSTNQGASVVDTQTGKTIRQWNFDLPTLQNTRLPLPPQSHVSADGTTVLALANGIAKTVVAIYDTKTGKQRGLWAYEDVERNARLSPDGRLWAFFPEGAKGLLIVHDARTGVKMWNKFQDYFWAWSADSQRIISLLNPSAAQSNARTGRDLGKVPGPHGAQALALDPNGDTFYTLDNQGKIWRWRLR